MCWYGLDQITVLGDFYREQVIWEDTDFPWIPTIEELVENVIFSCFANGYGDNILLEGSELTFEKFSKFLESPAPGVKTALQKISDYINRHAKELTLQASHIDTVGMKTLCQNILKEAKIRYRPKSPYEMELLLAAINDKLMNCQDSLANYLLVQTGHALLNEPVEIAEWSE